MSANGNANDYVTMSTFTAAIDRIDERFARVDERFEKIDQRFEKIDERFEKIDARFDKLEAILEKRAKEMVDFMDEAIASLRNHVTDYARWKIEDELRTRHGIQPSPDGALREELFSRTADTTRPISRREWVGVQHHMMQQREHRELSRRRDEQFDRRLCRVERTIAERASSPN